jgi:hypothetical protein
MADEARIAAALERLNAAIIARNDAERAMEQAAEVKCAADRALVDAKNALERREVEYRRALLDQPDPCGLYFAHPPVS